MREPQPEGQPRSPNPPGVLRRWPSLPGYVDTLALSAAIAVPLILYILTMPRAVALEDDGWFLIVGKFLGVGHPPGYPVHTLISNLFLKLPWGSPAFLGHLLSAVFGAFACGAVYICARLLGAAVVAAITSAWLFAVSEHFWAQAIITEVYTLNALCFFGIFALLLHLRRNPDDGRAWAGAAFLYGISLANHWPLMVFGITGLVARCRAPMAELRTAAATAGRRFPAYRPAAVRLDGLALLARADLQLPPARCAPSRTSLRTSRAKHTPASIPASPRDGRTGSSSCNGSAGRSCGS